MTKKKVPTQNCKCQHGKGAGSRNRFGDYSTSLMNLNRVQRGQGLFNPNFSLGVRLKVMNALRRSRNPAKTIYSVSA